MKDLTSEQIIRNFNLYLLSDIELEEPFISLYDSLNEFFGHLNVYEDVPEEEIDKNPYIEENIEDEFSKYYTYYGHSKDKLYIRYNDKNGHTWLDKNHICPFFESKHNIPYSTLKKVIEWYVIKILYLEGITDFTFYPFTKALVRLKQNLN